LRTNPSELDPAGIVSMAPDAQASGNRPNRIAACCDLIHSLPPQRVTQSLVPTRLHRRKTRRHGVEKSRSISTEGASRILLARRLPKDSPRFGHRLARHCA
jgi:hypothetical protein